MIIPSTNNDLSLFPVVDQEPNLVATCFAYLLPEQQQYIESQRPPFKKLMQDHRINTLRTDLRDVASWINTAVEKLLASNCGNKALVSESLKAISSNVTARLKAESDEAARAIAQREELNPILREENLQERLIEIKRELILVLSVLDHEAIDILPESFGAISHLGVIVKTHKDYSRINDDERANRFEKLLELKKIDAIVDLLNNRLTHLGFKEKSSLWLAQQLIEPLKQDMATLELLKNSAEHSNEYDEARQIAKNRAIPIIELYLKIVKGFDYTRNHDVSKEVLNICEYYELTLQALKTLSRMNLMFVMDKFRTFLSKAFDQGYIQSVLNIFNDIDVMSYDLVRLRLARYLIDKNKIEETNLLIEDIRNINNRKILMSQILYAWLKKGIDKAYEFIDHVSKQEYIDRLGLNSKNDLLSELVNLLLEQENISEAQQVYQRIDENQAYGKALKNTIEIDFVVYYINKNQFDTAEELYNNYGLNVEELLTKLAQGFVKNGHLNHAREILGKITGKHNQYYVLHGLVKAYLKLNNLAEAKALALAIPLLTRYAGTTRNQLLGMIAIAYVSKGEITEAKSLMDVIDEMDIKKEIGEKLFKYYIDHAQPEEAEALLELIKGHLSLTNIQLYTALIDAYIACGKRADAERVDRSSPIPRFPLQNLYKNESLIIREIPLSRRERVMGILHRLMQRVRQVVQALFQWMRKIAADLTILPKRVYRACVARRVAV